MKAPWQDDFAWLNEMEREGVLISLVPGGLVVSYPSKAVMGRHEVAIRYLEPLIHQALQLRGLYRLQEKEDGPGPK